MAQHIEIGRRIGQRAARVLLQGAGEDARRRDAGVEVAGEHVSEVLQP